jgi:uncharacterized surface protein with fasciclin (FAS1) repeats
MKFTAGLAVLMAVGVGACADAGTGLTEPERVDAEQAALRGPGLVDVALSVNASTGEFSTLIAALQAADLVEAIAAPGQRTVFAPTDAAFAELGLNEWNIGTLDTGTLTEILLYHVTPGRRQANSVAKATRLRMLNGDFTRISVQAGNVYIDNARIVQTDVLAANGVIHVIDSVLLP